MIESEVLNLKAQVEQQNNEIIQTVRSVANQYIEALRQEEIEEQMRMDELEFQNTNGSLQ